MNLSKRISRIRSLYKWFNYMGYEITLYIGRASKYKNERRYTLLPMMRIDLCKIGDGALSQLVSRVKKQENKYKVSILEGNKYTAKDRYDTQLKIADPQETLMALIRDNKKESYWRFSCAIDMLRRTIDNRPDNLYCVFYGH